LAVRVRLKVMVGGVEVVTSALVNSGFESDEPELIIPPTLAELLRVSGSTAAQYRVAGGGSTSGVRVEEKLMVKLMLGDRNVNEVEAVGTILPGEDEVIISDKLASKLKIVIIDPYEGLWCLRDELGRKVRKTASIQIWR